MTLLLLVIFEIVSIRAISDCNRLSCKLVNHSMMFNFIHKIASIQDNFFCAFNPAAMARYNTFEGRIRPAGRWLCIYALPCASHTSL